MKHCLLFLGFTIAFGSADSWGQPVGWQIVTADAAKIAVPRDWRNMDGIEATRPIYRQGDGAGVPSTDETGAPMQIGLTVEKFPTSEESTETIARELLKSATNNPQLVVVGKQSVESIVLSDQTATTLVTTEFIKSGSRRSFYMKLIGKDSNGQVWVVTGYLVSGKGSTWPTPKSKLSAWLRAHIVSLTLAGIDVDQQKIEAAYHARDKDEKAVEDSDTPRVGLTGIWTASWHDPQRNSRESFTMDLVQQGTNVAGAAVFMDGVGTKAKISGHATGSKIELLMTPDSTASYPAIPKTTWIGTLTNNTISGTWYLHGTRSDVSKGSWSASPK